MVNKLDQAEEVDAVMQGRAQQTLVSRL